MEFYESDANTGLTVWVPTRKFYLANDLTVDFDSFLLPWNIKF